MAEDRHGHHLILAGGNLVDRGDDRRSVGAGLGGPEQVSDGETGGG